ncbi:MAG: homoserine kinase [Thermomicrobiales bacterium]|nr:homoserine kinase [Thermomicrobiales bacterium]
MHSPLSCSIRVPASSANLGPGFDSLGMALDLWMQVDITRVDDPSGDIRVINCEDLLGGGNLVVEAMQVTANRYGRTLPACELSVRSDIPVARGLGSSAAAIVAGIHATAFLLDLELDSSDVVDIGGEMEGHADNISASELGGVTVSFRAEHGWIAEVLAAELPWTVVALVPDSPAFTSEARGILPTAIPMSDAAANIGRAAMLALALREGRSDLLRESTRDRLHQPYRAAIFPHLNPVIDAALAADALGAGLSGAGPTILAFADSADADAVATAMEATAAEHGFAGRALPLAVAPGALVEVRSGSHQRSRR